MRSVIFTPLAAIALLAASPSSSPASDATPTETATVICDVAPFYQYAPGSQIPTLAPVPVARQGARFDVLGYSTTLSSVVYVETNVVVIDNGFGPNAHYWLRYTCVSIDKKG